MPNVEFKYTADGVCSIQHRDLGDGHTHQRVSQVILPNMNGAAGLTDDDMSPSALNWTVPINAGSSSRGLTLDHDMSTVRAGMELQLDRGRTS